MLKTPLAEVLLACAQQRLADLPPLEWHEGSAVCVVMVAGGYPSSYEKGKVITGIDQVQTEGVTVFHAGTKLLNQEIITDGGRVLGVTCRDADFQSAIKSAYEAVAKIKFEDMYYRRDIGHRIMNKL